MVASHPAAPARPGRLVSVDLLRGLVMVLMALDHVRDYFTSLAFQPEDMRHTYPLLFATRWVTHFCAPGFFFLAGLGAYLSGRGAQPRELGAFLLKRGAWLIVLELTVVFWGWTFLFPLPGPALLVIWALGWSMVTLALLVRLPLPAIAAFGLALIAGHNLFDAVEPSRFGKFAWLWMVLHKQGLIPLGLHVAGLPEPFGIFVVYPLVPWLGVMAVGYAAGPIFKRPASERGRTLARLGLGLTALFVVLRSTGVYGDPPAGLTTGSPGPFAVQASPAMTVVSFLNVEKYPPSLQYLLMTLGPSLLLLAWFDRLDLASAWGRLAEKLLVFGRVPMFYYVLHIYLIHTLAILVALAWGQPTRSAVRGFMFGIEPGYGHGLAFIYCVWILVVVALYPACRWFAGVKQRRRDWWLGYV